jgi:hypothetical protein
MIDTSLLADLWRAYEQKKPDVPKLEIEYINCYKDVLVIICM